MHPPIGIYLVEVPSSLFPVGRRGEPVIPSKNTMYEYSGKNRRLHLTEEHEIFRDHLRSLVKSTWRIQYPIDHGRLGIYVELRCPKVRVMRHDVVPGVDATACLEPVRDALQGVAYDDDARVTSAIAAVTIGEPLSLRVALANVSVFEGIFAWRKYFEALPDSDTIGEWRSSTSTCAIT